MENQDSTNNQNNKMNTLTIDKIKSLKVALNVGNDYFIGSPEEQNKNVYVVKGAGHNSIYGMQEFSTIFSTPLIK